MDAYNGEFTLDWTPPRIIEATVQEGDVVSTGLLTCVLRFDEEIDASSLDEADFSLVGEVRGAVAPQAWNYDPAQRTLTLEFADTPDDAYTLTIFSRDGRF